MRLNLTHLPKLKKFRKSKRAGTKPCPYTRHDSFLEDGRRRSLIRHTVKQLAKSHRKCAKQLAKRLGYSRVPPSTAASAACLFELRERIVDHLVRLTWSLPEGEVFTAALIPEGSQLDSLNDLAAFQWLERLRKDLERAGGRTADGWVFAGPHGEHDPATDRFNVHYHLVICGHAMRAVVECLRDRGKYQLADISGAEPDDPRTPPIYIRNVKPDELRYALSYALQTFWPSRRRGRNSRGGRFAAPRARIKGVRHTEWLLWMDRQPIHRMFLLFNLGVGRQGLRPTKCRRARTPIKREAARCG